MGGNSPAQNTVSEFKPPSYTQAGGEGSTPGGTWQDYLSGITSLTQQGLPQYNGMTVAPMTNYQNTAGSMLNTMAQQGTPTGNAGNAMLVNTMRGGFADPFSVTDNPYIGNNPYLDKMVNDSNSKITQGYQRGTAAQTDAAAAKSGAFGGSAYDETVKGNQQQLADLLGQNTNSLYNQNYNQSAQLAENQLNRASGAYQNERQREMSAAGMAPAYSAMDLNEIGALNNFGGQQQDYLQKLLGSQFSDWQQQANQGFTLSDILGNALSRASTGQGQTSSSVVGQRTSPLAYAGGAAGLYGLLNG